MGSSSSTGYFVNSNNVKLQIGSGVPGVPGYMTENSIIIFSPDCSHCEKEAADLNKYADKFKNVVFVWDSYRDMELIKKFAEKYNLINRPNVLIGRDPNYMLPTFFRPRMTPFMAIYLKGTLLKVYEQGADVFELAKLIESN